MRLKHYIEYLLLIIAVFVLQHIPFRIGLFMLNILMDITFYALKIRRKTTINNLRQALGKEKTEQELIDIAHKVYRNSGFVFLEIVRFPKLSLDDVRRDTTIEGEEYLDKALKKGKGVVLVSGHIGNEEFLGQALHAFDYPVTFLVGEQRNKLVDRLFNQYRQQKGIRIIHRDFPLKKVLKTLKQKEIVTVVSDQDAGTGGMFVDFFGKKASTPQGAAMFALKTGASIVFTCDIVSDKYSKKHRIIFRPVEIEKTGDKERDAYLYTQKFTKLLEDFVRQYPEQYFWLHRRWKTRPPE